MEIFKHLPKKTRYISYQLGRDVNLDWLIAFVVFVILNLALIFFTMISYNGSDTDTALQQIQDSTDQKDNLLDTKLLAKIIDHFENNKAELENLNDHPVKTIDPSI